MDVRERFLSRKRVSKDLRFPASLAVASDSEDVDKVGLSGVRRDAAHVELFQAGYGDGRGVQMFTGGGFGGRFSTSVRAVGWGLAEAVALGGRRLGSEMVLFLGDGTASCCASGLKVFHSGGSGHSLIDPMWESVRALQGRAHSERGEASESKLGPSRDTNSWARASYCDAREGAP